MLLCDYAEALNGKLYIMGGGWDRLVKMGPVACSVAVMLSVPWNDANIKHRLSLTLLTEDGQVASDAAGNEVIIDGEFETGRPAGIRPGSALRTPFTFRIQGLDLDLGGYSVLLEIEGAAVARAEFDVVAPPGTSI